jgi:hypothetical protein
MSLSNHQVANRWAAGQDASGNNLRSDNGHLYSYSTIIGSHVMRDIFFVTIRGYSVTTSNHLTQAGRALGWNNPDVFYVDNVLARSKPEHKSNLNDYHQRVGELVKRARRARVHGVSLMSEAISLAKEANRYAALFKLAAIPVPEHDLPPAPATPEPPAPAAPEPVDMLLGDIPDAVHPKDEDEVAALREGAPRFRVLCESNIRWVVVDTAPEEPAERVYGVWAREERAQEEADHLNRMMAVCQPKDFASLLRGRQYIFHLGGGTS